MIIFPLDIVIFALNSANISWLRCENSIQTLRLHNTFGGFSFPLFCAPYHLLVDACHEWTHRLCPGGISCPQSCPGQGTPGVVLWDAAQGSGFLLIYCSHSKALLQLTVPMRFSFASETWSISSFVWQKL